MDFSREWSDLDKLSVMTEEIRRISPEARLNYYQKLLRKKDLYFVSRMGHFFMEWYAADINGKHNPNSWFLISRDVRMLKKLIEDGRYYDRHDWARTYKELYEQKEFLFNTGLGYEFLRELYLLLNPEKKNTLKETTKVPRSANPMPRRLGRFFMVLFFVVSIGALSIWGYLTIDSYRNKAQLEALHGSAPVAATSSAVSGSVSENATAKKDNESRQEQTKTPVLPPVLSEYETALSENNQLFGWLTSDGLSIDLPVVRPANGDDFYLDHDFYGNASDHGCLFVDSACDLYPLSNYVLIYGHNMRDGSMFGNIDYFADPSYLASHSSFFFDTIYEKGEYKAVATLRTRLLNEDEEGFRYYRMYQYKDRSQWDTFMDFAEENLAAGSLSELQYHDSLLLLSTCEYSQDNGRLVVVCKKITY